MRILITGSSGQLGSDLAPLLVNSGHDVTGYGSASLDVTDKAKVSEAVREARPEVIINCAAYTKVDLAEKERERAFSVNGAGVGNLAGAAADSGARLIHVSTDFIFDGAKGLPYVETDAANPLGVYGASKLEGERAAARLKEHVIVRTSWLYGVAGNNFVKTVLKYAAEREELRVVYDQVGSPTWTGDLAGAISAIVEAMGQDRMEYGIYNLSNEGVASWYDFAQAIIEEGATHGVDLKCKRLSPILTHEYPTPAKRPRYSVFDKTKIKKTLGLTIPHWRVSLRRMISDLYGGKDA